MAQAPNELDAIEALAAMAAGRLTAEALTRACLERIARARFRRAGVCLSWIRSARSPRLASRDRARRDRADR